MSGITFDEAGADPTVPALFGRDLEWREIRDALWLAGQVLGSLGQARLDRPAPGDRDQVSPRGGDDQGDSATGAPRWQDDSFANRTRPAHPTPSELGPSGERVSLAWPSIPALPNRAAITRALRPLRKPAPSPWRHELDEQATAERAAQDRLWLPQFRPEPWHEYELVVVVDTAGAMEIWGQTVRDLCELFRRLGAFRNVRTLSMDCAPHVARQITLRTNGSDAPPKSWRDEVDPTGRRVFLVLTDAIATGWRTGAASWVVAQWARGALTAIVNVLPQRLWPWGGLSPRRVQLHARSPGAPNTRLSVWPRISPSASDTIAIPVLGLEPDWWSEWVRLVVPPGTGLVNATAIFVDPGHPTIDEQDRGQPVPEDLSPRERVLRFRTFASLPAFQLAGLLAAAPLSLPTMKLVQRVLLPGSGLAAVAEVLLGGLLRRDPTHDPDDPHSVAYEFFDGVREELLSSSQRSDTIRVARLLTEQAAPVVPMMRNFREALERPDGTEEPEVSPENRPYLRVQEAVLRALSGPYAPRARRLRRKLGLPSVNLSVEPTPPEAIPPVEEERPASAQPGAGAATISEPPVEPEALLSGAGGDVTASGSTHSVDSGQLGTRQPRVWGAVPLRNPDFVGRGELLEQLRRRLLEPGGATAVLPEALHGMGGVGKSQTVIEYIYRHAAEYEVVWWIPAEHTTQIRASFVELGKKLGIPVGSSADAAAEAVLEALRSGEPYVRWILIFDNAEHPDVVRPFLPAGFGHVVVTSRNSEWAGVARTVEVDLFTREESITLLRRRGGEISDSDADQLAEALGDLPLAVEQAASWRAQTGMPVAEYLRLLEINSADLLKAGATGNYDLPVAAAWNVPLSRLRADRPEALELLQVCAFFGPEPIARSLFTGVRDAPVPDALREAFADPIKLNQAIREISRYSLAKIDHRNNTLQLHRLVQAVLRDQLDADQQESMRHAVHLMLVSDDPGDPANAANWPSYATLLPHAVGSQAVDCQDRWVRRLVANLVQYLNSSGDFHGSLQLAEQAWEGRRNTLGEDHLDTLMMGRYRGMALHRVGRVDEARAANKATYERMLETLGEDHEATIGMSDTVGFNFRVQGLLFEERDLAVSTLERARRVLGEEDPATLFYANSLAACHRLTGEYFQARELDEETLHRRIVVLGEEHPATLNTYSCLAMDVRECGAHLEACRMQEQTCARLVEVIGDDHPYTIGGNRCLAVARRKAGQHELAMELTEDCYERYRRRQGEVHVDTATGLMDMMTELRHIGELESSRKYGRLSVDRFVQIYSDEHPFALIATTNLAVTYRLLGDVEEAYRLNERARSGLVDKLNSDHPYTLVAMANLASDLAELGEVERARELDEDTLERCTRILRAEHPTTLAVAHNLSMDLNLLGEADRAAILHTKTVGSFRKVLNDDHPATVSASKNVRANCDADTMQL